jgi:phospho-N-acetylmuramoyl-pentapeptide-transferase
MNNLDGLSEITKTLLQWCLALFAPSFSNAVLPLLPFIYGLSTMLLIGKPMIHWLCRKNWIKDPTRIAGAMGEKIFDTYQKKSVPQMGGLGIIGSVVASTIGFGTTQVVVLQLLLYQSPTGFAQFLVWSITSALSLVPLLVIAFAMLGFADDWSRVTGRAGLGLATILTVQFGLSVVFVLCWLFRTRNMATADPRDLLPLAAVCVFVVIVSSNAVSLTDATDGLAAGLAVQAVVAFILVSPSVPVSPVMVGVLWPTLAGACVGFLFFNHYPARVLMGNSGALAIGAALGIGAILSRAVFLLPFIGFIYFAEMFSAIFCLLYSKWTRRSLRKNISLLHRAPLQRHLAVSGRSTWDIVLTFWLINLCTSATGLFLWNMDVLPHWPKKF